MTHQGLSALSSSGYSTTSLRSPVKTQPESGFIHKHPEHLTITPELAEYFLTKNTFPNQRKLSPERVKSLAGALIRGEWKEDSHQGIAFDKEGRLLDGQHRLAAIIKAQISAKMWVFFGLDKETYHCIDSNMKLRSIADVTGLPSFAAQIMSVFFYMLPGRGLKPTSDQIMNLYNALYPVIGDDMQKMARSTKRFYSNATARTAFLLRLATATPQEKIYIHDLYARIVSDSPASYAQLPFIGLAYKAEFENNKINKTGGGILKKTYFAYAWVVYNPANKNKKTIGIRSKDYDKTVAKINAHYEEGRKVLYELVGMTQSD